MKRFNVPPQVVSEPEPLAAHVALVVALAVVHHGDVLLEVASGAESLAADGARVLFLALVHDLDVPP